MTFFHCLLCSHMSTFPPVHRVVARFSPRRCVDNLWLHQAGVRPDDMTLMNISLPFQRMKTSPFFSRHLIVGLFVSLPLHSFLGNVLFFWCSVAKSTLAEEYHVYRTTLRCGINRAQCPLLQSYYSFCQFIFIIYKCWQIPARQWFERSTKPKRRLGDCHTLFGVNSHNFVVSMDWFAWWLTVTKW